MKIHYRKSSLVEQINNAIAVSAVPNAKPIDHFEFDQEEFSQHFSNLNKSHQQHGNTQYSFKSIPSKIIK